MYADEDSDQTIDLVALATSIWALKGGSSAYSISIYMKNSCSDSLSDVLIGSTGIKRKHLNNCFI